MSGRCFSRRSRVVLPLASIAVLITCGNVSRLDVFYTGDVLITPMEGQILTSITFSGFRDFDIGDTDEFREEGRVAEQVSSAEMLDLTVAVSSPEGGTLDFLARITFYAEADGLDPLEIATVDPVPRGVRELAFEITNPAIGDYVATGSMSIVARVLGTFPDETTALAAFFNLNVEVDLSSTGCSLSGVAPVAIRSDGRP